MVLVTFLTTPAYGLDWFPSMGLGELPAVAGGWQTVRVRAAHLFLPVLCLSYPGLAYLTRQIQKAAAAELKKSYVRAALMAGLSPRRIVWRHVLRNAAFPLATILGTIFPGMLAGSILIEQIFNLPGMGKLLYTSVLAGDWSVVTTLVLLNGVMTALGLLVADLTYGRLDPRVQLGAARPKTPLL